MDGDVLRSLETGPARESDLDDVVRVLEAADGALGLPPEPIREELTWLWHLPTTDLERDTRILRDGGAVIAYGRRRSGSTRMRAGLLTSPSESTLTTAVRASGPGC